MSDAAYEAYRLGHREYPDHFPSNRVSRCTFRSLVKEDDETVAAYTAYVAKFNTLEPEIEPDDHETLRQSIQAWARQEITVVNLWHEAAADMLWAQRQVRMREIFVAKTDQELTALYPPEIVELALYNYSEHLGRPATGAELLDSSAGVEGWAGKQ